MRTSPTKSGTYISVTEGSNVTLPCNVERPYLNKYTVTWTANGEKMSPLPPGHFDRELTNVSLSCHNTVYICRVETSIDQPETGADAVAAAVILKVIPQHTEHSK